MGTLHKVLVYFLILIISTVLNILFAQTANKTNWQEDLDIYRSSLKEKHIHLYHSVTEEEFTNEWNAIYDRVGNLGDFQIILELMRLTRLVNDGHTAVSLRNVPIHRFPFEVKFIDQG